MINHAHVPAVHNVRPRPVLEHGEVFAGPLLLHEVVLIPAGLGAGPPVGVPAGHIVAEQAPAAVADAHCPVDKRLQLQRPGGPRPDLPDLLQAQLPGQNHPPGPQLVPGQGGLVVGHAGLGGDVAVTPGGVPPRQGKGPHVRHNQRIHPGAVQDLQPRREAVRLPVAGHGVDGHMDPDPVLMGKADRPGQLLPGEVSRKGAHPEALPGQIHRIRAVEHRHAQALHVPRRRQELRLSPLPHGQFSALAAASATALLCWARVSLNTCCLLSGSRT